MIIKEPQRKKIELRNVLLYRTDAKSSDSMVKSINNFLLFNGISRSDAYVKIEHGRSIEDDLFDIELLVPVNASAKDITDERFEFADSIVFEDVVSVYYRGSLRLYRNCIQKLGTYLKENNLKAVSIIGMRYFQDKFNINENDDLAVEMFVQVEEKAEKQAYDDESNDSKIEGLLRYEDDAEQLDEIMEKIKHTLRRELSSSVYAKIVRNMRISHLMNDFISFACTRDVYGELDKKYEQLIGAVCKDVLGHDDMSVLFVPELEDEICEDEGDFFDADKTFKIAKEFMKANLSISTYDEYIEETLRCEYITRKGEVILCVDESKAYVIPILKQKYNLLIKKAFAYALGGKNPKLKFVTQSAMDGEQELLF